MTEKYGCHTANASHTAIILNGHADPTILHIYAKTYPTAISTSYVTAMHMPNTNMLFKCHIYAISKCKCELVHRQIGDNYVSIHTSYELNSFTNVTGNTGICTFHIMGTCP